ncbi:uncharacterized protein LOC104585015 [Brachypodium distachyon]|uniref:uncharacterized protein LOC104585015 n=1 Tax=Brachypodium distachyon TaxID=15368 RepID=UPI0001C70C87|nr:uncharacterized protein LOC104585015 [Brachypodium distachyon]|eukprot:XP_010239202.1 uncharacterized protein LOC104585015 [Brachypodium distachyon]
MAKNQLFLLLLAAGFVVVASSATPPTTSNSTAPTAYEMLGNYGFPPGILPQGVQSYVLNADGSFSVSLPSDCEIDVDGFKLRYKSSIHGNIKSMLINGLGGVSVNLAIFQSLGINGVERSGDKLKFEAGVVSKSFAVDIFAVSPRCN